MWMGRRRLIVLLGLVGIACVLSSPCHCFRGLSSIELGAQLCLTLQILSRVHESQCQRKVWESNLCPTKIRACHISQFLGCKTKRSVDKEIRYTVANIKTKSVSTWPSARSQQAIYRSGPLRAMYQEPAPVIQDLYLRQYTGPKIVYSVFMILQLGICRSFMSVNVVGLLSAFRREFFPIRSILSQYHNKHINSNAFSSFFSRF